MKILLPFLLVFTASCSCDISPEVEDISTPSGGYYNPEQDYDLSGYEDAKARWNTEN